MKKVNLKMVLFALLVCGSFLTTAHAATNGVGKAIISIGKVFTTNKDGKEKKLKRRGKVFEGDTIKVGKKSRLQLRFIDNQLVVLKENTVFRIDEYKFKDKNDQNKSAALSLLKGGMRSVTGLIGKSARDKYKVKTPVATMGVRGTHYLLQVCSGDCGDGVKGLVGTVLEGEIEMTNDGGSSVFGKDQFFNVPSSNDTPKTMTNPPATLVSQAETESNEEGDDGDDGEGEDTAGLGDDDGGDDPSDDSGADDSGTDNGTTDDDSGTEFSSSEQDSVDTTEGIISTTRPVYNGTAAPANSGIIITGIAADVADAEGGVGINGISATINLETVSGVGNQPVNTSLIDPLENISFQVSDGAVAVDQGGDAMLGVNWGRWQSADVTVSEGSGAEFSLKNGLSFIYSDNLTPDLTTLTSLGNQIYTFAGGPTVFDASGQVLAEDPNNPLAVLVDFTNQRIDDFGGVFIGQDDGRVYSFAFANAMAPVLFADLQSGAAELTLSGLCTGGVCGSGISLSGSGNGFFIGPSAEGLIGYFALSDTAETTAFSGAGLFTQFSAQ